MEAEASFLPGITVYLTNWFPARDRARAVGGYIIAGSGGGRHSSFRAANRIIFLEER
jgi:MFS family permease